MANSSGKITAPVRQKADVQYVLTGSTSGSAALSDLCTHANIKPFAKYKPVRNTSATPDRTTNINPWWKVDGDCGLVPYILSRGYSDVVNHCDGTMNGWQYLKPNGSTYPYRLLDFDKYNHNVSTSVKMFSIAPPTVGTSASSEFVARLQNPSGTDALHWIDFDTIKYAYFGIYAVKSGSGISHRVTAQSSLYGGGGEGSGDMFSVSTYGWSTGTYQVYPFFADEALIDGGGDMANIYWSVPMTSPITLTVSNALTSVVIRNYKVFTDDPLYYQDGYRGYKITASVSITNAGLSAVTFSSNVWQVRYYTWQETQPLVEGESEGSISSVTVNANSATNVSITGVVTTEAYDEGARLYVKFSSGSITLTDDVEIDNGRPPM